MSKRVRQQRKALLPLKATIGRPTPFNWTGNTAFKKTKGKKFDLLCRILDDKEFQAFCAVIGWVEVNWAIMEQQLTWWTKVIYLDFGGSAIETEAPMAFSRKSAFLRKAFKRIPTLMAFRADADSILDRADKLSETRHDLTHAVITHMKPIRGRYEMQNLRIDKKGAHTLTDVVFDVRRFPRLSEELALLGRDAIALSLRFQRTFGIPRQ